VLSRRLVAGIMRKRRGPCQSRPTAPRLLKHRNPAQYCKHNGRPFITVAACKKRQKRDGTP
jgi:hypothetical protein